MRKKILSMLVACILVTGVASGCASQTQPDQSSPVENEQQSSQAKSLEGWQGTWNGFNTYFENPDLEQAYSTLAEREGITPEEVKARYIDGKTYQCDIAAINVSGDTITFYSKPQSTDASKEDIVATQSYTYKGEVTDDFDRTWAHFESEKDANYPHIFLLPAEADDPESTMLHFHFRYGSSVDELKSAEGWYPTMVRYDNDTKLIVGHMTYEKEQNNVFDASAYYIPQAEAIKLMGLEAAPVSAVGIGRAPSLAGVDAGINMIGIPNDDHIPEEYRESSALITNESGEIDWVQIKELAPSVILMDQSTKDKYAVEIEKVGIPVYVPQYDTFDDVYVQIGIISSAFGTNDVAALAMENYSSRVADMLLESKDAPQKTVALLRITADGYVLYAGGNYVDSLVQTINVRNIAQDMGIADTNENNGMVPIELSDLIAANPDAIIVMVTTPRDQRDADFNTLMEEFAKDEYKSMNAVSNQKIVRVDHHPFVIPGMFAVNGIESVFTVVYE